MLAAEWTGLAMIVISARLAWKLLMSLQDHAEAGFNTTPWWAKNTGHAVRAHLFSSEVSTVTRVWKSSS